MERIKVSNKRSFFSMIPNIVWEWGLSPHQFALLMFYLRAGTIEGEYFPTADIATLTSMSVGMVSKVRVQLEELELIKTEYFTNGDGRQRLAVEVVDMWALNDQFDPKNSALITRSYHEPVHGVNGDQPKPVHGVNGLHINNINNNIKGTGHEWQDGGELEAMVTCLIPICKKDPLAIDKQDVISAKVLVAMGVTTAEIVLGFGKGRTFWYQNFPGSKGQWPTPKDIVAKINHARDWLPQKERLEIVDPMSPQIIAWNQVANWVAGRTGASEFTDREKTIQAIREIGGEATLKRANDYELNHQLKAKFINAFMGVGNEPSLTA